MKREILINGSQRETRVAILEDDRLVELLVDRPDHRRSVGDIYLGRVEAVLPGIHQAARLERGDNLRRQPARRQRIDRATTRVHSSRLRGAHRAVG